MIAGLCESPLTFQAIIIWRDELKEGKMFLRDIIDLEATYGGPDTHPPDRGQGAAQTEAPQPVKRAQELPRRLIWTRASLLMTCASAQMSCS
jgi:hypothetical protein